MSPDNTSDLPELWSHVPHTHLRYRAGDKVADIDAEATPGFTGSKSDAPALMAERNERFAGLQEMLYANSRSGDHRSVLLVLQGMDTAGKGGIVKHVVGASNPQGIQYKSFGKPTPRSSRTTTCGGSTRRFPRPGTSASSTARTTRMC